MNAVHPTLMDSMAPFMGGVFGTPRSAGMFSNNPVADAADHFDALADTFDWMVNYIGLELDVTINKHTLRVQEIYSDGECIYYELSEKARDNIARIAIRESGV